MTRLSDILWAVRCTIICWWRGHAWDEFTRTRRGIREHCRYCPRCDTTEVMG